MKKLFLAIFFNLIFLHFCQGQKVTVANEKMNILFNCVTNPISVTAEKISCKLLVVKTTNGIIQGQNCEYICTPDRIGSADIIVYKKNNGSLIEIARTTFRVKRVSEMPVFKIGSGKHLISFREIIQQDSVRAELENIDLDMHFPIERFMVEIISKDSSKLTMENSGAVLSNELKEVFKKLKPNDKIIFTDIYIKLVCEQHVAIDSREFVIKE